MRREAIDALRAICPLGRRDRGERSPLGLATADRVDGNEVLEGILRCSAAACLREYPILDGIPILVPALRAYVGANVQSLIERPDLSERLESIVGDCCGPGSPFDLERQYLSSYGFDHYGDLDPDETILERLQVELERGRPEAAVKEDEPIPEAVQLARSFDRSLTAAARVSHAILTESRDSYEKLVADWLRKEIEIQKPEVQPLGIYFMFSKPGERWKTSRAQPLPSSVDIDLDDSEIKQES